MIKMAKFVAIWWLIFFVTIFYGWFLNLLALIHTEIVTGETIVRGIGVVIPPIGAIMGYFF